MQFLIAHQTIQAENDNDSDEASSNDSENGAQSAQTNTVYKEEPGIIIEGPQDHKKVWGVFGYVGGIDDEDYVQQKLSGYCCECFEFELDAQGAINGLDDSYCKSLKGASEQGGGLGSESKK